LGTNRVIGLNTDNSIYYEHTFGDIPQRLDKWLSKYYRFFAEYMRLVLVGDTNAMNKVIKGDYI